MLTKEDILRKAAEFGTKAVAKAEPYLDRVAPHAIVGLDRAAGLLVKGADRCEGRLAMAGQVLSTAAGLCSAGREALRMREALRSMNDAFVNDLFGANTGQDEQMTAEEAQRVLQGLFGNLINELEQELEQEEENASDADTKNDKVDPDLSEEEAFGEDFLPGMECYSPKDGLFEKMSVQLGLKPEPKKEDEVDKKTEEALKLIESLLAEPTKED